jgi:cell division septation protein DedD
VVAVVIFLCGVLVGQGVRTEQTRLAAEAATANPDPTLVDAAAPAPVEGTRSQNELFTYPTLLEGQDVPLERLSASPDGASSVSVQAAKPPVAAPVTSPAAGASASTGTVTARPAAQAPAPARRDASPATATSRAAAPPRAAPEPAGTGFVVQVAAVREREEADAMARRLTAKGYPAFVTSPAGPARIFRVRIGKYNDRREAETVAGRLEKEEQFKPWITR